jgi:hypothetical protein
VTGIAFTQKIDSYLDENRRRPGTRAPKKTGVPPARQTPQAHLIACCCLIQHQKRIRGVLDSNFFMVRHGSHVEAPL